MSRSIQVFVKQVIQLFLQTVNLFSAVMVWWCASGIASDHFLSFYLKMTKGHCRIEREWNKFVSCDVKIWILNYFHVVYNTWPSVRWISQIPLFVAPHYDQPQLYVKVMESDINYSNRNVPSTHIVQVHQYNDSPGTFFAYCQRVCTWGLGDWEIISATKKSNGLWPNAPSSMHMLSDIKGFCCHINANGTRISQT